MLECFLSGFCPSRPTRAHLPITARTKPPSTQERCLFCPDSEILEQTSSTSSLGTLRFYLQKNSWTVIGPKSSLKHLRNFCPHSLTIFSILLPYTNHVFSLNTQSPSRLCGYNWPLWPFLPLINKLIKALVFFRFSEAKSIRFFSRTRNVKPQHIFIISHKIFNHCSCHCHVVNRCTHPSYNC